MLLALDESRYSHVTALSHGDTATFSMITPRACQRYEWRNRSFYMQACVATRRDLQPLNAAAAIRRVSRKPLRLSVALPLKTRSGSQRVPRKQGLTDRQTGHEPGVRGPEKVRW